LLGGGVTQRDGDPLRVQAVDDGEANNNEQRTWLRCDNV
jgi:hypothetical protein